MVPWIVVLSIYSFHRDLHIEICLIEVLISCVVGHIVAHMSNLVKLTVLIEILITIVHRIDLSGLNRDILNRHCVAL